MQLKFLREKTFEKEIHRAGWNWVIQHMYKKYHDPNASVLVDDFLEKTFDWEYCYGKTQTLAHHKQDWIGFLHNPLLVTKPFDIKHSFLNICSRIPFLVALKKCKGIYVLSEDLKESLDYLIRSFNINYVQIDTIKHPTDTNVLFFDYEKFIDNPKIVNIGYWLRNFEPYFLLKTNYPKHCVLGKLDYAHSVYKAQKDVFDKKCQMTNRTYSPVKTHSFMTNEEYDEFLQSSIAFLNLIDTSANNGVIECIARNIPLLVNPLPAVVEYLGEKYPFYYLDQEEANMKINDIELIKETHQYLKTMDKSFLEIDEYLHSFETSSIFINL